MGVVPVAPAPLLRCGWAKRILKCAGAYADKRPVETLSDQKPVNLEPLLAGECQATF